MFVRYVLQQALQEILLCAAKASVAFRAMIQVTEADFAVRVFFGQAVHGDHRTLQVTPQVMNVAFSVGTGFGKMHDPVLLVMAVQPAVEGGPVWALGFQRRRQCQLPPVPGCSKQVNDGIAPLGHQGCAAEVQGFPAFTIRGDSAPGHRQVNVGVPGQAAAKGMQDGKDPHEYLLFFTNFQDHPGRQPGQVIEQVTVVTEQFPECIWHGEGDVLPGAIGHHGLLLLHPLIGEFLATRGTEPAFAGERHVFTKLTVRVAALVYRDTANVAATGQHSHNVFNNGAAHCLPMFQIEAPPESVAKEQPLKLVKTLNGLILGHDGRHIITVCQNVGPAILIGHGKLEPGISRRKTMLLSLECRACHRVFDANVGHVEFADKGRGLKPVFEKPPHCPKCGERSNEQVYLTEVGQGQLTEAWFQGES